MLQEFVLIESINSLYSLVKDNDNKYNCHLDDSLPLIYLNIRNLKCLHIISQKRNTDSLSDLYSKLDKIINVLCMYILLNFNDLLKKNKCAWLNIIQILADIGYNGSCQFILNLLDNIFLVFFKNNADLTNYHIQNEIFVKLMIFLNRRDHFLQNSYFQNYFLNLMYYIDHGILTNEKKYMKNKIKILLKKSEYAQMALLEHLQITFSKESINTNYITIDLLYYIMKELSTTNASAQLIETNSNYSNMVKFVTNVLRNSLEVKKLNNFIVELSPCLCFINSNELTLQSDELLNNCSRLLRRETEHYINLFLKIFKYADLTLLSCDINKIIINLNLLDCIENSSEVVKLASLQFFNLCITKIEDIQIIREYLVLFGKNAVKASNLKQKIAWLKGLSLLCNNLVVRKLDVSVLDSIPWQTNVFANYLPGLDNTEDVQLLIIQIADFNLRYLNTEVDLHICLIRKLFQIIQNDKISKKIKFYVIKSLLNIVDIDRLSKSGIINELFTVSKFLIQNILTSIRNDSRALCLICLLFILKMIAQNNALIYSQTDLDTIRSIFISPNSVMNLLSNIQKASIDEHLCHLDILKTLIQCDLPQLHSLIFPIDAISFDNLEPIIDGNTVYSERNITLSNGNTFLNRFFVFLEFNFKEIPNIDFFKGVLFLLLCIYEKRILRYLPTQDEVSIPPKYSSFFDYLSEHNTILLQKPKLSFFLYMICISFYDFFTEHDHHLYVDQFSVNPIVMNLWDLITLRQIKDCNHNFSFHRSTFVLLLKDIRFLLNHLYVNYNIRNLGIETFYSILACHPHIDLIRIKSQCIQDTSYTQLYRNPIYLPDKTLCNHPIIPSIRHLTYILESSFMKPMNGCRFGFHIALLFALSQLKTLNDTSNTYEVNPYLDNLINFTILNLETDMISSFSKKFYYYLLDDTQLFKNNLSTLLSTSSTTKLESITPDNDISEISSLAKAHENQYTMMLSSKSVCKQTLKVKTTAELKVYNDQKNLRYRLKILFYRCRYMLDALRILYLNSILHLSQRIPDYILNLINLYHSPILRIQIDSILQSIVIAQFKKMNCIYPIEWTRIICNITLNRPWKPLKLLDILNRMSLTKTDDWTQESFNIVYPVLHNILFDLSFDDEDMYVNSLQIVLYLVSNHQIQMNEEAILDCLMKISYKIPKLLQWVVEILKSLCKRNISSLTMHKMIIFVSHYHSLLRECVLDSLKDSADMSRELTVYYYINQFDVDHHTIQYISKNKISNISFESSTEDIQYAISLFQEESNTNYNSVISVGIMHLILDLVSNGKLDQEFILNWISNLYESVLNVSIRSSYVHCLALLASEGLFTEKTIVLNLFEFVLKSIDTLDIQTLDQSNIIYLVDQLESLGNQLISHISCHHVEDIVQFFNQSLPLNKSQIVPNSISPTISQYNNDLTLASGILFIERLHNTDTVIHPVCESIMNTLLNKKIESVYLKKKITQSLLSLFHRCTVCQASSPHKVYSDMFDDIFSDTSMTLKSGQCFILAAYIHLFGIQSLNATDFTKIIQKNLDRKNKPHKTHNALLCLESCLLILGRTFEPYIYFNYEVMLNCLNSNDISIRLLTQSVLNRLSENGSEYLVRLLLRNSIKLFKNQPKKVCLGLLETIQIMLKTYPNEIQNFLPVLIPVSTELLIDLNIDICQATKTLLENISQHYEDIAVKNLIHGYLRVLLNPSLRTFESILKYIQTQSVNCHYNLCHFCLILPIFQTILKNPSVDIKCNGGATIAYLTLNKDIAHLFNHYFDEFKNMLFSEFVNHSEKVRYGLAKSLACITSILDDTKQEHFINILVGLLSESQSPMMRSGVAYTIALIFKLLDISFFKAFLPSLLSKISESTGSAQESFIGLFFFLGIYLRNHFDVFLPEILPYIIKLLGSSTESVVDITLYVLEVYIEIFGIPYTILIFNALEESLFNPEWKIRSSGVLLCGFLLHKLIQGTGDGSSLMNGEGTSLTVERRAFILSSIYLLGHDDHFTVKQYAYQAWKSLVRNTPKTLQEIIPILSLRLIRNLTSNSHLKQKLSADCIGSLTKKLGVVFLNEILPNVFVSTLSEDLNKSIGGLRTICQIMINGSTRSLTQYQSKFEEILREKLLEKDHVYPKDIIQVYINQLIRLFGSSILNPLLNDLLEQFTLYPCNNSNDLLLHSQLLQLNALQILVECQYSHAIYPIMNILQTSPIDYSKIYLLKLWDHIQLDRDTLDAFNYIFNVFIKMIQLRSYLVFSNEAIDQSKNETNMKNAIDPHVTLYEPALLLENHHSLDSNHVAGNASLGNANEQKSTQGLIHLNSSDHGVDQHQLSSIDSSNSSKCLDGMQHKDMNHATEGNNRTTFHLKENDKYTFNHMKLLTRRPNRNVQFTFHPVLFANKNIISDELSSEIETIQSGVVKKIVSSKPNFIEFVTLLISEIYQCKSNFDFSLRSLKNYWDQNKLQIQGDHHQFSLWINQLNTDSVLFDKHNDIRYRRYCLMRCLREGIQLVHIDYFNETILMELIRCCVPLVLVDPFSDVRNESYLILEVVLSIMRNPIYYHHIYEIFGLINNQAFDIDIDSYDESFRIYGFSSENTINLFQCFYYDVLISANNEYRDIVLDCLRKLVIHSKDDTLNSIVLKLSGPLLRCIIVPCSQKIQIGILKIFSILIKKCSTGIQPLIPQLQLLYIRLISESNDETIKLVQKNIILIGRTFPQRIETIVGAIVHKMNLTEKENTLLYYIAVIEKLLYVNDGWSLSLQEKLVNTFQLMLCETKYPAKIHSALSMCMGIYLSIQVDATSLKDTMESCFSLYLKSDCFIAPLSLSKIMLCCVTSSTFWKKVHQINIFDSFTYYFDFIISNTNPAVAMSGFLMLIQILAKGNNEEFLRMFALDLLVQYHLTILNILEKTSQEVYSSFYQNLSLLIQLNNMDILEEQTKIISKLLIKGLAYNNIAISSKILSSLYVLTQDTSSNSELLIYKISNILSEDTEYIVSLKNFIDHS